MKKLTPLFFVLVVSALAGGCVVSGTMRTHAYVSTPDMVAIDGGVYVVQDYDRPVFYSDDYYWWYDNGAWYRSGYYDRGFVRVDVVPDRIRTIHEPYGYVHYRGGGEVRPIARDHRDNGWHNGEERREDRREDNGGEGRVKVRDHRDEPARVESHDEGRVKVHDHRH